MTSLRRVRADVVRWMHGPLTLFLPANAYVSPPTQTSCRDSRTKSSHIASARYVRVCLVPPTSVSVLRLTLPMLRRTRRSLYVCQALVSLDLTADLADAKACDVSEARYGVLCSGWAGGWWPCRCCVECVRL